jgi:hypothetical protein
MSFYMVNMQYEKEREGKKKKKNNNFGLNHAELPHTCHLERKRTSRRIE